MVGREVAYYIKSVKTPFSEWLGCATKYCKDHKKDKQVCHIRPETDIFPVGNGLYECKECHDKLKNSRQGDFWTLRDVYPNTPPVEQLSEQEAKDLHDRLAEIRLSEEKHPVPPELTKEEEKQRHKARQLKRRQLVSR